MGFRTGSNRNQNLSHVIMALVVIGLVVLALA